MARIPVLAIHGGAGTINRAALTPEAEKEYREALRAILEQGRDALARGACALDAATLAVSLLEDCPLFNAGRGAVYTSAETHELDAAVMDGATRRTGAVCCVHGVRNPIKAARAVMEKSPHVLMTGEGALDFLRRQGVDFAPDAYFDTEQRLAQLRQAQAADPGAMLLDHDGAARWAFESGQPLDEKTKMGTVGAVALDAEGRLAAATSTGGMTNKLPGRVGDTPVVGAGCYADDVAAVSCTGSGEYFIRAVAGHDVAARMRYAGSGLAEAAQAVLEGIGKLGGNGGLIAVDSEGHVALPFISEGMYRGCVRPGEEPKVGIYRDDEADFPLPS